MTKHNPQIENHLETLADICCESLGTDQPTSENRTQALIESLVMSGYGRDHSGVNLQSELDARLKQRCREPAIHRGGAVSAMTARIGRQFDEIVRWKTRQPRQDDALNETGSVTGS